MAYVAWTTALYDGLPKVSPTVGTFAPLHWLIAKPCETCSAMKWPKTENLLVKLWSMRTTSSFRFVGAVAAADETGLPSSSDAGKMPAVEQRRCVRVDHARRNDVARERRALHDAGGQHAAGAILRENGCGNLSRGRHVDRRVAAEVAAVSGRTGYRLAVGDAALNQTAPFHVVEEEGLLAVAVVELAETLPGRRR